jgi:hypothetical protein
MAALLEWQPYWEGSPIGMAALLGGQPYWNGSPIERTALLGGQPSYLYRDGKLLLIREAASGGNAISKTRPFRHGIDPSIDWAGGEAREDQAFPAPHMSAAAPLQLRHCHNCDIATLAQYIST